MSIKDWPELTRPKEKAMVYGVSSLSDEELLAIIINSGIKNFSSLDIARILLKDGIRSLGKMSYHCLIETPGISNHKALVLTCIFELLKRYEKSNVTSRIRYHSSLEIVQHIKYEFSLENEEKVLLIVLDNHNVIKKEVVIANGQHNTVQFSISSIFQLVLKNNCVRFIIVHNHPDGDVKPSKEDIMSTNEISRRARILELKLVDHIIISKDDYFSFLDNHIL